MAHGKWTEVEARAALRAWKKSGLSVRQFALQRGLTPERLYNWRKKLGPEPEEAVGLVAVELSEPAPRGEPVLVMLRSGHMLKVGRDFDEHAFTRVVQVLERC